MKIARFPNYIPIKKCLTLLWVQIFFRGLALGNAVLEASTLNGSKSLKKQCRRIKFCMIRGFATIVIISLLENLVKAKVFPRFAIQLA